MLGILTVKEYKHNTTTTIATTLAITITLALTIAITSIVIIIKKR